MSAPLPCIIALGPQSEGLARQLASALPGEALIAPADPVAAMREVFMAGRPLIGLCASGILIRALCGLLADKRAEPPVIAVSAHGKDIVPLLGGHGGANELARRIGWITGGYAAITTATDNRFHLALDDPPKGYRLANPQDVKAFAAALLRGEAVRLEGHALWISRSGLPLKADGPLRITVTEKALSGSPGHLVYHPATLCLGVGLARGAAAEEVAALADGCMKEAGLAGAALAAMGTLDIKADEPALAALSRELGVPLRLFDAQRLAQIDVPNPSEVVARETGTPSVAEAAALALAGDGGKLIVTKTKSANATCAIALAPRPVTDPPGKPRGALFVTGLGPGAPDMRTPRAARALMDASDWVGYGLYLDLAGDLAAGKRLHPFPLGKERDRVRHALKLAEEGRQVALLCSGDAAIYAMAALVFEELDKAAQEGALARCAVEVIPGVSAFQAASARAGALIGHDFCAISLSDLLTPWETIEKRLAAAAAGDFVTALYNPRSRRRTRQLERALEIFRAHRPPSTPVIIAANLGRENEKVRVVTLGQSDPREVDMLSIVLIGNGASRILVRGDGQLQAWTPRGYGRKEEA